MITDLPIDQYKSIAVLHNHFIEAQYCMNVFEMRLFIAMLERLEKNDAHFPLLRIPITEILPEGYASNRGYELIKEACKLLAKKTIEIEILETEASVQRKLSSKRSKPRNIRRFTTIPLMGIASYLENEGYVETMFNDLVKPYLLELKDHFTRAEICELIKLKTFTAFRFYWLLKQYERIGKRTIELEDLKVILIASETYSRYFDFKKRVLIPALDEINQTDLRIEYEEIREGNVVKALKFRIISSNNKETKPVAVLAEKVAAPAANGNGKVPIEVVLRDLGLDPPQIKAVSAHFSPQEIYQLSYQINTYFIDQRPANRGAYAYAQFENALRFKK